MSGIVLAASAAPPAVAPLVAAPAEPAAVPSRPAPAGGGTQGTNVQLELQPAGATAPPAGANSGAGRAGADASGAAGQAPLPENSDVLFRFRLTDHGGAPLGGLYPAAWLYGAAPAVPGSGGGGGGGGAAPTAAGAGAGSAATPASSANGGCQERVKELFEGSVFSQADLDLNVYYVLTLNDDASISVVDPLFSYGGSRLLAMVSLGSPGYDWALAPDRARLFVSMPAGGQIAVVDTTKFAVAENLATGGRPLRLGIQPDGGYLWAIVESAHATPAPTAAPPPTATTPPTASPVAAASPAPTAANGPAASAAPSQAGSQTGDVAVAYDAHTLRRVATIPLAAGPHALAFSDDSRFLFVTNGAAGSVTVVDVAHLAQPPATLTVGRRATAVAWSSSAGLAYVTDADAGAVVAVAAGGAAGGPGAAPSIVARVAAEAGVGAIAFAPGGRLGFVVDGATDHVHILDAVSNRIIQTAKVDHEPDQVVFSAELAYVRHRGSETILTIPLKAIGQPGAVVAVMDVPGGQHPFGQGAAPSPAAGMARAPGANAMLIANPADMAVYYYQEGMAAPMGSFRELERQPRALLVLDRSLHEAAPGVYEAAARLPRAGHYQLAFFVDAPRLLHCFAVEIAADPRLAEERRRAAPPQVQYLIADREVAANRQLALRFQLRDASNGQPLADLSDVQVLFYRPPGNDRRIVAAHQLEPGIYGADLPLGGPGAYSVFVQSETAHLPYHLAPPLLLEAKAAPGAR